MDKTSDLTDEQVVELVTKKDKETYSQIIKRYQDKLLRYADYIVRDEQNAADVVQESFIKAFVNLNGFDTKRKFSSWLYRIVHNEAMNFVKKQKGKVVFDKSVDFDSGVDLEEELIVKELKMHAKKCLEKMPIIYSESLALFFLEEKSYEEISDILRIPVGTVGTRINRAKILMQKICQKRL